MLVHTPEDGETRPFADWIKPFSHGKVWMPSETDQVILDGHHSFEAARLDGVEPEFRIATNQDHDAIKMIAQGKFAEFLEAVYYGEDYRDAYTGAFVW